MFGINTSLNFPLIINITEIVQFHIGDRASFPVSGSVIV